MMTSDQFNLWCSKNNITEAAKTFINKIRTSPPSRNVTSNRGNVSGCYPSKKMGMGIQFESRSIELGAIIKYEHDDEVLEYYDQIQEIKLNYTSKNKNIGVWYRADFLVLRKKTVTVEEWKSETHLIELQVKQPERYLLDLAGNWSCPPAEEAFNQIGIKYVLCSSAQLNWTFLKNTELLSDYIWGSHDINDEAILSITQYLGQNPASTITTILGIFPEVKIDHILYLIANAKIYCDLSEVLLTSHDLVKIYSSKIQRDGLVMFEQNSVVKPAMFSEVVGPGSIIKYDARDYQIKSMNMDVIVMEDTNNIPLTIPRGTFDKMFEQGKILLEEKNDKNQLKAMTDKELSIVMERHKILCKYWEGSLDDNELKSNIRTIQRWNRNYQFAQECDGNGLLGLVPKNYRKGNKKPRFEDSVYEKAKKYIEEYYLTKIAPSRQITYAGYRHSQTAAGDVYVSSRTFNRIIDQINITKRTFIREGSKAAYQIYTPTPTSGEGPTLHGDRPFEKAYIDHTLLDQEVIDSETGMNLGRPWLTVMIDGYTRIILAFWLSYDAPSYRTLMLMVRFCVKKNNILPRIISVDGGKEFSSTYFTMLLTRCGSIIEKRPPCMPRFGSVIESLFGKLNVTVAHNMVGNTKGTKLIRQLSRSHNPKDLAVWNLHDLNALFTEYFFECYDVTEHSGIQMSPRQKHELGMTKSGMRLHTKIKYDMQFIIMTLPAPSPATRRNIQGKGLKLHYNYYWNQALNDSSIIGTNLDVRFDPMDISYIYARIKNQWVRCVSERYGLFKGMSEKQLITITQTMIKSQKDSRKRQIDSSSIAKFMEEKKDREDYLLQKKKDAASEASRKKLMNIEALEESMPDNIIEMSSVHQTHCEGIEAGDLKNEFKNEIYGEVE